MKPEIGIPYDSRNDLGYGRTKEKFHKQRSRSQSYPYPEADQFDSDSVDDVLSDEEADKLIQKIPTMGYQINDPNDDASTDKFYYVAGNTKLSDCIYAHSLFISWFNSSYFSFWVLPHHYIPIEMV